MVMVAVVMAGINHLLEREEEIIFFCSLGSKVHSFFFFILLSIFSLSLCSFEDLLYGRLTWILIVSIFFWGGEFRELHPRTVRTFQFDINKFRQYTMAEYISSSNEYMMN